MLFFYSPKWVYLGFVFLFFSSCSGTGANTTPLAITDKYSKPLFSGMLGNIEIEDQVFLHPSNLSFGKKDVKEYFVKNVKKTMAESGAFSDSGNPIDIHITRLSINFRSNFRPITSDTNVIYKFTQANKTLLRIKVKSSGSDVSFSGNEAIIRAVVKSLNHNMEGLVLAFKKYDTDQVMIEESVGSKGDVSVFDWLLVSPALGFVKAVDATGSALASTAEFVHDNAGAIQYASQVFQETQKQAHQSNLRIQELKRLAAQKRSQRIAENERLKKLDAKNKRQQIQNEQGYKQRQLAQAQQQPNHNQPVTPSSYGEEPLPYSGSHGSNVSIPSSNSVNKDTPSSAKSNNPKPLSKNTTDNNIDSLNDGCWSGYRAGVACLQYSSYEKNEKTYIKLTNVCHKRLYMGWCAGKQCGADGLRGGQEKTKYEFIIGEPVTASAVGSTKPSQDWVCRDIYE